MLKIRKMELIRSVSVVLWGKRVKLNEKVYAAGTMNHCILFSFNLIELTIQLAKDTNHS